MNGLDYLRTLTLPLAHINPAERGGEYGISQLSNNPPNTTSTTNPTSTTPYTNNLRPSDRHSQKRIPSCGIVSGIMAEVEMGRLGARRW